MAPTDPSLSWEAAALRDSRKRRRPPSPAFAPKPPADIPAGHVTLREAHHETGLPIETLRKWARRGHVPSRLVDTEFGTRRVVDLTAVRDRATELGRPATPTPEPESSVEPTQARPESASASTDTMIVPIAAWDRILTQLGNLHEAGKDLAEARERAAKAETEAAFLRERLAELRARYEPVPDAPPTPVAPPPPPQEPPTWRRLADRWSRRRG